jgi:hypothetical protein
MANVVQQHIAMEKSETAFFRCHIYMSVSEEEEVNFYL